MSNKPKRHPVHYTVFQPNVLLGANTDLKLAEIRLYTEILNFNHREEPERLVYQVPYEHITQMEDKDAISRKAAQEFRRIAKTLQQRVFELDKDFMKQHFGEDYEISIIAFPVIRYKQGHFEFELNRYFKAILTKLDLGFTKGDIELLRQFKHEASHRLYWLIRYHQWKYKAQSIEVDLPTLKEILGCEGQYERYQNFKVRILEPIKEELKGTWVEFDYEAVKGGWGSAVQSIKFHFNNDIENEKSLKLGTAYDWEETLLKMGIVERDVVKIRHYVTQGQEVKPSCPWDSFYIWACIRIAQDQIKQRNTNAKMEKIKNPASYLFAALTEGWWVEEVSELRKQELHRQQQNEKLQKQLSFFEEETKTLIAQQKKQKDKKVIVAKPIVKIPYQEFKEMHQEFNKQNGQPLSEEEFATYCGYVIKGDFVEKT